ncbi:sulfurtransferase complex subunit TusB [Marinobacter nauticus]|uniref:sulfurtransferase complex subunit TusB n=1 Tax=Marinobacter nauticus TaxID=2743 RepID=UPI001C59A558|nr:sulfurtransferase complex subunit TusB [Marinobacter nauticus]MBW3196411.1 sulfurtransferase complex subunit TusB [Marinobacter nauticus]MBY6181821.1 sulfurtransferase complex subunit TusB [Marinobacter nauticus]
MPANVNTTLHIINKAPEHARFRHCLASVQQGDTLLLIEDAVLALLDRERQLPGASYGLETDANARAVANRVPAEQLVDYAGFVQLTVNHSRIINW